MRLLLHGALVQFLKQTDVRIILRLFGNISDRVDLIPRVGIDALSVDEKVGR